MRLKDKNAIVTGAASGIGRAIALRFGQEGANVCLIDRAPLEKTQAVASQIENLGRQALALQADLSKVLEIDRAVGQAVDRFGQIDILVNCAGIYYLRTFEETTEEEFDKSFAVNIKSVFFMSQRVLPAMLKAGKGKIVNIGSIFGMIGGQNASAYGASKLAIHGLSRQLAIELASQKINVNVIAPGSIETPINDELYARYGKDFIKSLYPIARFGQPEEIASAAVFLASDEADWITGVVLPVDGGYVAQ